MFFDPFLGETSLHLAVIQNDIQEVALLAKNETLRHSPNRWNFTPLELAQFFGSQECIERLDSDPFEGIKVVLKGDEKLHELSPEEFQQVFGVSYRKRLRFADYSFFKEVIRNCPWILRNSFLGKENRDLGMLYKEQLSAGFTEKLLIKWIGDSFGYGVFALEDIPEGAFVGEYTGVVRRLLRSHPDPNAYCFHYPTRFWSWKYFTIDASKEGNILRFANHSDQPNLQPMCLFDRGLLHLVFFAKNLIHKGSQLTFDYGRDYWVRRKKLKL